MRTKSKTPGLRIVGGTAFGSIGTEINTDKEFISRRPELQRLAIDPTATETAKNGKLREQRYQIWRMAEAATRYWRIRLDFERAVSDAQRLEYQRPATIPSTIRTGNCSNAGVRRWRGNFSLPHLILHTSHGSKTRWPEANMNTPV
jgi:hypothetical protein